MWIDFHTFFQQFLKDYLKINVAKIVFNVCIGIHYDADAVICMIYLLEKLLQGMRKRFL